MRFPRRRRRSHFVWLPEYDELALFNAEVARGVQHTAEKQARMKDLQAAYDEALALHHAQIGVARTG